MQSPYTVMIRKNLLFCKIIRIKTSSKSLFDAYMALFRPDRETCPVCSSSGNCRIHAYYGRHITDFMSGRPVTSDICVLRVFCDSCRHSHAVLPDVIVPYSGYSLFFLLRLLGEYFSGLFTVEALCERFGILRNQLYKWIHLWHIHKEEWLGVLANAQVSDLAFLKGILSYSSHSSFSMHFAIRCDNSFLQSHANPPPAGSKTARYHQTVYAPDISVF